MNSPDEAWLSLFVIALFGSLLFLRMKFPNASRGSETVVLLSATLLFFWICNSLLKPGTPPFLTERVLQTQGQIVPTARR